MWIDSEWAYWYCKDTEDDPEIRKYITDPELAFEYCKEINDAMVPIKMVNYINIL